MRRRWMAGVIMLTLLVALTAVAQPGGVESQEPAGTDGWPIYSDAVYGYRVLYPPGWEVQRVFENAGGEPYLIRRRVAFQGRQEPPIEIDVWQREAGTAMEQWFPAVEGIPMPAEANAVISGQEAFVVVQPGGCGVPTALSTYVPTEDRVFKIYTQYASDRASLYAYEQMLRSFSLEGAGPGAQSQTTLPDLGALVPQECGTNVCPSTCSGGCTFAPMIEGCCGYHAVSRWQCSRQCIESQIGNFLGNCVWWGAYTRQDVGALASGNAENWAISVRNTGQLPVDTTPKVGDIVVHPGGSYNHVAYVVWVSADGTSYQMSDMGWCSDCGPAPEETKLRSVDADDEFIHCKGDPAIPTSDWTFSHCPFGWTPNKGFSASELTGSAWVLNPAQDPYLLSPVLSVPAGTYKRIEIHMASLAGNMMSKIYFTTASSPTFDETKTSSFLSDNDGSWKTYVVDMSSQPQWQGTITRIRLDPVEAGNEDNSQDDIGIARIRLVPAAPLPAYWIHLPLVQRDPTTEPPNQPPHTPADPVPADGATGQPLSLTLSWTGGDPDGDVVAYDVYLNAGDDTPQTPVCEGSSTPACDPGLLLGGTQYSWQVIASDAHSATSAGPAWTFTTAPTGCVEILANGGFEGSDAWEIPATAYRAAYSTAEAHSDARSMRVGIVDAADNVYSYSSARQLASLPIAVAGATLGYWLYPLSEEPEAVATPGPAPASAAEEEALAGDAQYVLILSDNNVRLETLLWQRRDDRSWSYHEADLSAYAGRTIKVQFGVYNDGLGGVTGMYVDDVSLLVCSP